MGIQEQAFRAYYASMSDADLLSTAKNKNSFIPIAQIAMDAELMRRQLKLPPEAPAETSHGPTPFAKMLELLRHRSPRQSDRAKRV
jgi:hypothetical protein